jgi:hypothetical protein
MSDHKLVPEEDPTGGIELLTVGMTPGQGPRPGFQASVEGCWTNSSSPR